VQEGSYIRIFKRSSNVLVYYKFRLRNTTKTLDGH
jgi:hypothetical protein